MGGRHERRPHEPRAVFEHDEREQWADRLALRVDINRDACRILDRILARTDLAPDLRFELQMLCAALSGPRGRVVP